MKKRRGHFCWSCGRIRSNEAFSGRGHAKHLCRECSRLGKDELAYRQAVRNIDRCFNGEGLLRRQHRATFEKFLRHPDAYVRLYAAERAAEDRRFLFRNGVDVEQDLDACEPVEPEDRLWPEAQLELDEDLLLERHSRSSVETCSEYDGYGGPTAEDPALPSHEDQL